MPELMNCSRNGSQMFLNEDERLELLALLEESVLSDWERRRKQMHAAEARLGMREGGHFNGREFAGIIHRARTGKPLTHDEYIVANLGLLPGELKEKTDNGCFSRKDKRARGRILLAPELYLAG